MQPTEPDPYAPEALLRSLSVKHAALREVLAAVAADLERLACSHPAQAAVFLARAKRIRQRLWELT